ncbi:MAG: molybdate ABC transporter substrate-binding protein [Chloroflexi bacterium]|nr:molybdate ABC transporter substrate-binding protein [Chloroflexota bacterium]
MRRLTIIAVAIALGTAMAIGCSRDADVPLIHAAASLVDVLEEAGAEYEAETGKSVRFSFAGSNLIANQIIAGAPGDAVIFAGETPIDKLVVAEKVAESEIAQILSNRLVVVKSSSSVANHNDPSQLVGAGKIAIPDPATSPAGEYVEAALRELGLLDSLQDQIVPTLNVRAALAAAESGNVAYAFVYRTDALSTTGVEIVFDISGMTETTKPKYYAAPISGDGPTREFIEFLQSLAARTIFERHGFER